MKIRRELTRKLYRQKVYGLENEPCHFEEAMLDAILGGETETLKFLISSGMVSLSAGMRRLARNELRNEKYHFMIMATFLAEVCRDGGLSRDEAYAIADIYCQEADEISVCDGLQTLWEDMCLDFAERIREAKKENVASIPVRKCIAYIYENLGTDLSPKELADFVNLTPSYLSKVFKQETGKTIKSYVTAAKMDTAQNLLKYSNLSCSEIAMSLGYCSQSSFTYAFRHFTGITPRRYRVSRHIR